MRRWCDLGRAVAVLAKQHLERYGIVRTPSQVFRLWARSKCPRARRDVSWPFAFFHVEAHTVRMPEPSSIAVVGEFPTVFRVWLWRNVEIVSWFGRPGSAQAVQRLGAITGEVLERLGPGKLSFVHILPNGLDLPDAPTRAALLTIARLYASQTACIAVVVAGTGFWASAMRSFVTGFRMLAPRVFDLRIHGTIAELLPWFPEEHARATGVQIDGDELVRQLQYASAQP
jgi:hypothetical protein